jgi:hypothetical protein
MEYSTIYKKYEALLETLKKIIEKSQGRVLKEVPDEIFSDNTNFFVKSYLINICTYLEAYLQDIAYEHSLRVSRRLEQARIPHNFLYGKITKEVREKDLKYTDASYSYSKKDLADLISGNPYKTINAFRLIGIDVKSSEKFMENKDIVGTIVNKRNNIIHHNDDASDISFSDLLIHIDIFLIYMLSIEKLLSTSEGST